MSDTTTELSIIVLGSGTSVPSPARRPPAYLVRYGATTILLECGAGASSSLARAGVGLDRLTGIVLTHLHLDHCGDLAPLLFALANPAHPCREQDLRLWGPVGTAAYLERLAELYGHWVQPLGCAIQVTELKDGQAVEVGATRWTAHAVEHSGPSLAFRVEVPGFGFCYSGDSGSCPGLERAARGAALLLCECSALEQDPLAGHLTATEVGRIAAAAGCREVVLTHLYPHVEQSDPAARVRQCFNGRVRLAEDGMVLGRNEGRTP